MFDGGDQFHQFIASSRTSLPIPLSFPLHGNSSFDSYAAAVAPPPPPPLRSSDPWSNDELLALLKLRSSMEIWFPDFTWDHVSRKLGELGFKRSGEQCKEKFDEESRHFTSNKNYRILSELDEFCNADDDQERDRVDREKVGVVEENEKNVNPSQEIVEDVAAATTTEKTKTKTSKKKRRRDTFEMFKGLCEAVVSKMMSKQEELHNKLIEDMVKMDEEKIAREEMWKNQEMDRIQKEIEIRTREQKSAAERQATIIDFLKQFTSDSSNNSQDHQIKANNISNSNSSTSNYRDDVGTPSTIHDAAKESAVAAAAAGGDVGKRWPRDEVLALIKLRCKMSGEAAEGAKGPLWERISQGMAELGYKRNAKRCKEKWENINKYFRKTKDSSKKRSVNSRTCPYFHHLSCLYSDGTIAMPENNPH